MTRTDLNKTEYQLYYNQYIEKLREDTTLRLGFKTGMEQAITFFRSIDQDKHNFKYSPDKWSIKEILQHLIDTERIFMYRCFRIAHNDQTPLAGFDQNLYAEPSDAENKSMEELINEFKTTRMAFTSLLDSLSDQNLSYTGNANENIMSARSAAFITLGHVIWHIDIIKEKYL